MLKCRALDFFQYWWAEVIHLVVGHRLEIIINHRLESVAAVDAIF